MSQTVYDEHARFYLEFVDRGLADSSGLFQLLKTTFVALLGDRLAGSRVCDVACGEGYLGRYLAERGASEVVGVDLSSALIAEAKHRSDSPKLTYRVDDAHELRSVLDASMDIAVCQMALMDIADHQRAFRAVRRILTDPGMFVFSVLHPCFDGSPFHVPEAPKYARDDAGNATACVVTRYSTEGFWQSGGTGVRGHMGSHHRTVSTYVNDLVEAGFQLVRVAEPVLLDAGLFSELPITMVIAAEVK